MHIWVTAGTGEGPTPLAAFDAALLKAGVANYNLLCLSSVIPPGSTVERTRFVSPPDEYGHRLYVVIARQEAMTLGEGAWAGLGWTQEPGDSRGLFVECHGTSRAVVEQDIDATLAAMTTNRGRVYSTIEREITGVKSSGTPVCALVVAVYEAKAWG